MKLLLFCFIVLVSCGLGYIMEPGLRLGLTGLDPLAKSKKSEEPAASAITPTAAISEAKPAAVAEPSSAPAAPVVAVEPQAAPPEEAKPAVAAAPEPAPAAEMKTEEAKPEPAPATPEPAPTAAASAEPLSPEKIVSTIQESVRNGQIKEFTFEQVTDWNAGNDEEIEGVKYQTGTAGYNSETIFGVKKILAKALIQNGKVTKWIWPTSGLEIQ